MYQQNYTTSVILKVYSQTAGRDLPDSFAHPSEVTLQMRSLQELDGGLGLVGGGGGAVLAHHRLVGRHGEGSNAVVLRGVAVKLSEHLCRQKISRCKHLSQTLKQVRKNEQHFRVIQHKHVLMRCSTRKQKYIAQHLLPNLCDNQTHNETMQALISHNKINLDK